MKPEGVQLRRADGTILACELIHEHDETQDPDGIDCWRIAGAVYQPGDELTVEHIDRGTSLTFTSDAEPDDVDISWNPDPK